MASAVACKKRGPYVYELVKYEQVECNNFEYENYAVFEINMTVIVINIIVIVIIIINNVIIIITIII